MEACWWLIDRNLCVFTLVTTADFCQPLSRNHTKYTLLDKPENFINCLVMSVRADQPPSAIRQNLGFVIHQNAAS